MLQFTEESFVNLRSWVHTETSGGRLPHTGQTPGSTDMSMIDRFRGHRASARRARAIERALRAANTPAARSELQAIVNRYR